MAKSTTYFLVARDKSNDTVKFITIAGGWGDTLEDIDLFTTDYASPRKLIEYLQKINEIKSENVDLFIVSRGKNKDNSDINIQEVLYSDSQEIKRIAWGFKDNDFKKCDKDIEKILNNFCYQMESNPDFNDMVIYGQTNIYPKFKKYFIDSKYETVYDLKYKDGAWAKKSYYLLRNIFETFSRYKKNNVSEKNIKDRERVRTELVQKTASEYDENQLCFFDMDFSNDTTIEDKKIEIMDTIDRIDTDTIIGIDDIPAINKDKFIIENAKEKEDFSNLLDSDIVCLIAYLKQYQVQMSNNEFFKDYYQDLINACKKNILIGLEDLEVLNNTYLWCTLYNKYNDRRLGAVHEYRKN